MTNNYSQSWKQFYADLETDILKKTSEPTFLEDSNKKLSTLKIVWEILLAFAVVLSVAWCLRVLEDKIGLEAKAAADDVPTYYEHSDQELLRKTFLDGYVGLHRLPINFNSS